MLSMDKLIAHIPRTFLPVVVVLGLFTISRFIAKTAGVLLQTFILPGTSIKNYASRSGNSWAVITGATDGIGKEFALQLAKAGYNILLVSRTTGKLNAVASEIATKFTSSKTKTLAIDFSAPTESDYRALEEVCNELDVGILVNNVGRSHEFPVSFAQTTLDEQQAIINININGTLRVTQIVLNKMLAQHRGLVLTLSSFAGAIPSPLLATYSASKAFLQTWSDALQAELKGNGIDVECVSTYFVVSNMSRIRRATAFIPMPKTYVSSVLRKVGLSCGALWTGRPSTSTPYWSHALLDYLINVVGWKAGFIGYTHALHKDIRKRALRKKEREAISAEKQN